MQEESLGLLAVSDDALPVEAGVRGAEFIIFNGGFSIEVQLRQILLMFWTVYIVLMLAIHDCFVITNLFNEVDSLDLQL